MARSRGFKAELARKMGVGPSMIQRYLDGERTPGLEVVDKMAEALGVSPWDLINPNPGKQVIDADLLEKLNNADPAHVEKINAGIRAYFEGVEKANEAFKTP